MSSTTALPTALQPSHSIDNITAHPGSTWAGASVALVTVGNSLANGLPTSTAGWLTMGMTLMASLLAALGK